jgi:signal peptidase I
VDINRHSQIRLATGSFARWVAETTLLVALAFLLAMALKATVAQAFEIPTPSMEPTIMAHDRVLAEKITPRLGTPAIGDVVVIANPVGGSVPFIKRVIALPGQTVDVKGGAVWVDGKRLTEPYTHGLPSERLSFPLPATIPPGHVWVMGDNRTNSGDGRVFGPVPTSSILARALCIYWPPKDIGGLQGGR